MYLMESIWGFTKTELNIEEHEVTFDEAAAVLLSETAIRLEDEIRFISARRVTRKEREFYDKGI